jgi:hypothetical protein
MFTLSVSPGFAPARHGHLKGPCGPQPRRRGLHVRAHGYAARAVPGQGHALAGRRCRGGPCRATGPLQVRERAHFEAHWGRAGSHRTPERGQARKSQRRREPRAESRGAWPRRSGPPSGAGLDVPHLALPVRDLFSPGRHVARGTCVEPVARAVKSGRPNRHSPH